MKTDQQMEVKINKDLIIKVGHKTRIGKADEVFKHGNWLREQKGLRPYRDIHTILKKRSFWESIVATQTLRTNNEAKIQTSESEVCRSVGVDEPYSSDFSGLDDYYCKRTGEMEANKLIKLFPNLIKSQRGGRVENRGYWMDLNILLKLATMLDPDLEAQIFDVFIKGKILELRDQGGDQFVLLNKAIDTLPDRTPELKPDGNKGCYISIAKMIRAKLELDGKGYNGDDCDSFIHNKRIKYEEKLVSFIELGFVKSFEELKLTVERLT